MVREIASRVGKADSTRRNGKGSGARRGSSGIPPESVVDVGSAASSIAANGPGHLAVCKLRVSLPRPYWHPEMARKHPETRIDVLGYSLMDDGLLVDMRVHVNDITTWIDELREFDDVHDVKPLGRVGKAVTVRATYTINDFFAVVNRLHLILRTPVSIKDGDFDVMMAGPEANVERFIKMFPSQVQVLAVYDSEKDEGTVLTRDPHGVGWQVGSRSIQPFRDACGRGEEAA